MEWHVRLCTRGAYVIGITAGLHHTRVKLFPMPPAASLRSNFTWTFAGNTIYAAGQWAILSLLAKLGSSEMLGQYALAIALTAPVVMFSHLNLRAVIATDVAQKHPFQDYLAVRLIATTFSLVSIGLTARFAISM